MSKNLVKRFFPATKVHNGARRKTVGYKRKLLKIPLTEEVEAYGRRIEARKGT